VGLARLPKVRMYPTSFGVTGSARGLGLRGGGTFRAATRSQVIPEAFGSA